MFICSFPDCPASYDKEWKLEAHLCKHTGVRPFGCEYEGCSKSFCTKYHLSRHILTHTGEKPYKCSEDGCTKGFTTNSNLQKHISCKHKLEGKQYICTFEGCGKMFKKNNLLKIHECTHTNLLPYECSHEGCEKRFANPSKQKRHEKVHQGYPCTAEDCSFMGKNWTELTKHKKEHKVKIQCDQCKKTFRDRWFLQQHQHVHSEERVVFRCPRESCSRSYTTLFNLQSHILSFHEEERAFTCPHPSCGKSFSMKQSLLRHGVAHDPERKKQKKPRPKRSLASRLSGYKPPGRSQLKTSEARQATRQSEPSKSEGGAVLNLSEFVIDENPNSTSEPLIMKPNILPTKPLASSTEEIMLLQPSSFKDHEPSQSWPQESDSSDTRVAEPHLLESPVCQLECVKAMNVDVSQSELSTSKNGEIIHSAFIHSEQMEVNGSENLVTEIFESLKSDSLMNVQVEPILAHCT